MEWIESLPISAPQSGILYYLAHRLGADYSCTPGCQRIAVAVKLHRNTVIRSLKELESSGIVAVNRARSRKGNTYYKKITLNVPAQYRPGRHKPSTGPVFGVSRRGVLTPADASTSVGPKSIQHRENKYSGEIEEETRYGNPDLKISVARGQTKKKTSEGNSPRRNHVVEKGEINKPIVNRDQIYLLREEDRVAARAIVWWEVFGKQSANQLVGQSQLVNGKLIPGEVELHTRRVIDASVLAADYRESCLKAPKARIAFWHQAGRLFYPQLRQFREDHRLTKLSSDQFHNAFSYLNTSACYVIGWLMANWQQLAKEEYKRYGFLDSLVECTDNLYEGWLNDLRPVIALRTAETKLLVKNLGLKKYLDKLMGQ